MNQNEYKDPEHWIFKEKWHYEFKLSNGKTTPTYTKSSQKWHNNRRNAIFKQLEKYGSLKGKKCLDIACNSGFWSIELAEKGAIVDGFDQGEFIISQARAISAHYGYDISFTQDDLFTFNPNGQYDVIFCLGIIYHLTDPVGACKKIREWSRGVVIFDTALSDFSGPVLEIGDHEKYNCCTDREFSFVPTAEAFEAICKRTGFKKVGRVFDGVYTEDFLRGLWVAI